MDSSKSWQMILWEVIMAVILTFTAGFFNIKKYILSILGLIIFTVILIVTIIYRESAELEIKKTQYIKLCFEELSNNFKKLFHKLKNNKK